MQVQVTNFSQVGDAVPKTDARAPVRGAVFDCDGLLADTAGIWTAAFEATAAAAGGSLDAIDPALLHGASVGLAARRIGEGLGGEVSEADLLGRLRGLIEAGAIEAMPGARSLLERLAGRLPLAVATNAPADLAEAVLRRVGLRRFVGPLVGVGGRVEPKPAPDVYLEACRRLGLRPAEAVAFEDSALGARAARAAGTFVVGVTAAGTRLDADLIVPRLDDERVLALLGIPTNPPSGGGPAAGKQRSQDATPGTDLQRLAHTG
jgi:HAD superfamily hydrolase (TIGR01509 family)